MITIAGEEVTEPIPVDDVADGDDDVDDADAVDDEETADGDGGVAGDDDTAGDEDAADDEEEVAELGFRRSDGRGDRIGSKKAGGGRMTFARHRSSALWRLKLARP